MYRTLLFFALLLSAISYCPAARAIECTEVGGGGVNIYSPGHYCLSGDMASAATAGALITIDSDDVLLDCRGHALRSTNTSPSGNAYGVTIINNRNVQIRNCRIIGGFAAGIYVYQDNGLTNLNRNLKLTNNDVSGTYWYGIFAYGTDIEISGNRISNVGGRASFAMGIRVGASNVPGEGRFHVVRDNIVSKVVSTVNHGYGIYANNTQYSEFTGNTVTGTEGDETWYGYGIRLAGGGNARLAGNHIVGVGDGYGIGIQATSADACFHNYLRVDTATMGCVATPGNY